MSKFKVEINYVLLYITTEEPLSTQNDQIIVKAKFDWVILYFTTAVQDQAIITITDLSNNPFMKLSYSQLVTQA